jgi:hypothetical protein
MLYRGFAIRKREGWRRHRVRVYRVWRFDTLEIGDSMDVLNANKWHSARRAAYQFGERAGRRFTTSKVWIEGRYTDHRVLRIERIE